MSLLVDSEGHLNPTLNALWQAAHAKDAQEAEALSFWQHLFAKHIFPEEHFICDAEIRPSPGDRRRIDRSIRFLSIEREIVVLCWHEAKDKETPGAIKECERQALQACIKSLQSHAWQQSVYAFTIAKTQGKAWSYSKGDSELVPLSENGYVEANSNEGSRLRKCFERMKSFPPANVLGAPNSNIASQPHSVRTQAAAPTPTNPGQISHATTPAQAGNPIFPRAETTTDSRTQTIMPS